MKKALHIACLAALMTIVGCRDYTLDIKVSPATVPPGGSGKITVHTSAHGKYHLDPKGMAMITFEPSDKIFLEKNVLNQEDNVGNFTYVAIFRAAPAAPPGPAQIKGTVIFQLCADELCRLINEERIIDINISN